MQILVLGMHRSGTSMVSRLLNLLGAYFAPESVSIGANPDNPKGFWERRDVRSLNDMLLHSAGCDWNRVSQFELTKIPEDTLENFRREARKIILGMDAYRPWFLKEPRFCLLAPLWLDLLEIPILLHVYRHPLEVARSLEKRNKIPLEVGLALWEFYAAAALNAGRGKATLLICHADLMAQPIETVRKLQRDLKSVGVGGLRDLSDEEITAFIDAKLHTASSTENEPTLLTPAQTALVEGYMSVATGGKDGLQKVSNSALEVLRSFEKKQDDAQAMQTLNAAKESTKSLEAEATKQLAEQSKLLVQMEEKLAIAEQALATQAEQLQQLKLTEEIDVNSSTASSDAVLLEIASLKNAISQVSEKHETEKLAQEAISNAAAKEVNDAFLSEIVSLRKAIDEAAEIKLNHDLNVSAHLQSDLVSRRAEISKLKNQVEAGSAHASKLQTAAEAIQVENLKLRSQLALEKASSAKHHANFNESQNANLKLKTDLVASSSQLELSRQGKVSDQNQKALADIQKQLSATKQLAVEKDRIIRRKDDELNTQQGRVERREAKVQKLKELLKKAEQQNLRVLRSSRWKLGGLLTFNPSKEKQSGSFQEDYKEWEKSTRNIPTQRQESPAPSEQKKNSTNRGLTRS